MSDLSAIYTVPDAATLNELYNITPSYMEPSTIPDAVVFERALDRDQCDRIARVGMEEEPYSFHSCNATTREILKPGIPFHRLEELSRIINDIYFGFELFDQTAAWLQTYEKYDDYDSHTDGYPGQTRKMTAVLMLTDEHEYDGGSLVIKTMAGETVIPRTQGTICVFPAWLWHRVTPVSRGVRQTINLGFWGPTFK